jgi:hypothetical protein
VKGVCLWEKTTSAKLYCIFWSSLLTSSFVNSNTRNLICNNFNFNFNFNLKIMILYAYVLCLRILASSRILRYDHRRQSPTFQGRGSITRGGRIKEGNWRRGHPLGCSPWRGMAWRSSTSARRKKGGTTYWASSGRMGLMAIRLRKWFFELEI